MPKYFYFCTSCGSELDFYHQMNESVEDCTICEEKTLQRRPSSFFSKTKNSDKKTTGDLVKNTIEEIKIELKKEKKQLKKEYNKSDE